jgi:hypothetical protein
MCLLSPWGADLDSGGSLVNNGPHVVEQSIRAGPGGSWLVGMAGGALGRSSRDAMNQGSRSGMSPDHA